MSSSPQPGRQGFTLIEVLVAVSIIVTLLALVVPAVMNTRQAARRTECINNLHNLGTAVHQFSTAHNGELPELTTESGSAGNAPLAWSWIVPLLPHMDQGAVAREINEFNGVTGTTPFGAGSLPTLPSLVCPAGSQGSGVSGTMSYVANAGYILGTDWGDSNLHHAERINWNRNCSPPYCPEPAVTRSDRQYAYATGVFWRTLTDDGYRTSIDSISSSDGLTSTFMISENVQAGSWDATTTGRIAFGISISVDDTLAPHTISSTMTGNCCPNPNVSCYRFGAGCAPSNVPANLILRPSFTLVDPVHGNDARINTDLVAPTGNRVRAAIAGRPPHTTWHAGPHQAVQRSGASDAQRLFRLTSP